MKEIPIPESLRSSPYFWDSAAKDSTATWISDVPELQMLLESIILLPDFRRRLAAALRNNRQLTHLALETGYVTQFVLDCVSTITTLERLAFGHMRAPDISGLANLNRLKYLQIESLSSASTLQPLTQLKNLISLGIGISKKITSLEEFSENSLHSLQALFLGESSERVITVDSIAPLGAVPSLEYIVLGRIRSRDKKLAGLLNLPRLKALAINKNARFSTHDIISLESQGVAVSTF